MKNHLILILFFAILQLNCLGQDESSRDYHYGNILTNVIIKKSNGYLIEEKYDDGWAWKIGIPEFYNFDFVRRDIKDIINTYRDLTIWNNWRCINQESEVYVTSLKVEDFDGVFYVMFAKKHPFILLFILNNRN